MLDIRMIWGGRGVNVPAFQSPCSALEGKNSGKTPKIPRVFIMFPMKIASITNFIQFSGTTPICCGCVLK